MPITDEFTGRVVLITGAGRGFGRALALAFAAHSALVAANDITPINLDETMDLIQQAGGSARAYLADVSHRMQVQLMVDQIHADWGRLDILINSTAVAPRAALFEMDDWDWQRVLEVNLGGPFLTMQIAGRAIREGGGGAILNLAAAGSADLSNRAAFLASQAGLSALTRAAAREFLAYNIRVNALCFDYREEDPSQDTLEQVCEQALQICSPSARGMTGQSIHVGA
jgi:NAD(P)-dependent dehydrogenase (short-subunit alcohol dehydrogenase family)